MKQDDPRLVFWSEDQWLTSKGQVQAIHDSHWLADDQGRIAIASGAPVMLSIVGERHPVVAVFVGVLE